MRTARTRSARVIFASLSDDRPLGDLLKIVATCLAAAVIASSAAALVITGFEAQARAHDSGETPLLGDARIAVGVVVLAGLMGSESSR
jgi:hypothetical protein